MYSGLILTFTSTVSLKLTVSALGPCHGPRRFLALTPRRPNTQSGGSRGAIRNSAMHVLRAPRTPCILPVSRVLLIASNISLTPRNPSPTCRSRRCARRHRVCTSVSARVRRRLQIPSHIWFEPRCLRPYSGGPHLHTVKRSIMSRWTARSTRARAAPCC
ncbi:hypothetical protein B0H15DRAFT_862689 [Mycena belliarum]|uniref:Secreted protein n=1 Tax=Mycena belliarum TaxID=1033014 RepID=A0AAD6XKA2_9AGAR|nr:hypothetical protein B0H15DRAFT_862689 [Mycena belliae]